MTRPRNKFDALLVKNALAELTSFLDEFDPDDSEDVQVRTGRLITSFKKAELINRASMDSDRLRDAVEGFKLKVAKRDELVVIAEEFEDLTSSYGGTPADEDMESALTILKELVDALRTPLERLLADLVQR